MEWQAPTGARDAAANTPLEVKARLRGGLLHIIVSETPHTLMAS